jgi:hypothetical protein
MTITTPAPALRGLRTQRSKWVRRLVAVLVYALVLVLAKWGGDELKSHQFACPLVSSPAPAGETVVTYADDTGNGRMSGAIASAVGSWNRAGSNVRLVSSSGAAALTFRAGAKASTIPSCPNAKPRNVSVTFSSSQWDATTGPHVVLDPAASVAKVIGRALGLPSGGTCPDLMARANCASRRASPSASEVARIDRLYPG